MTPARPDSPRWLDERGGVSWVTALLLLGLAAGVYLLWAWGPVYIVHYEVKQVVRDYANQAVKNTNDTRQRELMVQKLALLEQFDTVDEYGRPARIPAVNVRPEQVIWERTQEPPALHIAFEYTRPVRYPLVDRVDETTLEIDATYDITRPEWGPAR
jgi:hypothetical protein